MFHACHAMMLVSEVRLAVCLHALPCHHYIASGYAKGQQTSKLISSKQSHLALYQHGSRRHAHAAVHTTNSSLCHLTHVARRTAQNKDVLTVISRAFTMQAYVCAASVVARDASKTCQINVEDLTPEAFRPFGQVDPHQDADVALSTLDVSSARPWCWARCVGHSQMARALTRRMRSWCWTRAPHGTAASQLRMTSSSLHRRAASCAGRG